LAFIGKLPGAADLQDSVEGSGFFEAELSALELADCGAIATPWRFSQ
jgi:hypothetical protein